METLTEENLVCPKLFPLQTPTGSLPWYGEPGLLRKIFLADPGSERKSADLGAGVEKIQILWPCLSN